LNAVITAKRTVTTGAFASGTILYSWKQQVPALLTGAFEDPVNYRSGTVTSDTVWESPAVEINNADVDVGTNVVLSQHGYVLGVMTYEFSYTPPSAAFTPTITTVHGGYTITADNTWQDTGLTITTSATGVYQINCQVGMSGLANVVTQLRARLLIDGSEVAVGWAAAGVGSANLEMIPLIWAASIASGKVVKVQAWRSSGATWTQSQLFDTSGVVGTYLQLVQIG
jgi:hypothetical protein